MENWYCFAAPVPACRYGDTFVCVCVCACIYIYICIQLYTILCSEAPVRKQHITKRYIHSEDKSVAKVVAAAVKEDEDEEDKDEEAAGAKAVRQQLQQLQQQR